MSTTETEREPGAEPFGPRPVLSPARAAVSALTGAEPSQLWALSGEEVAEALWKLELIRAAAERLQVAVLREASQRGLGAEDGWGPIDWARRSAPCMTEQHAATLLTVAKAEADHRLEAVTNAVATGDVSVAKAAQLCRFHGEVKGIADPQELADITRDLLKGASGTDGLTGRQLALAIRHAERFLKPDKELVNEERVHRAHRALYKSAGPAGMTTYRILLDAEGAAILDAAIDPLARPHTRACAEEGCGCSQRNGETRETLQDGPDLRTAAARRADALLMVIGRGVASPGEAPKTSKSQLVVTMSLESLIKGIRGVWSDPGR